MSPLASVPNRGYPDWQRQSNMDSGVLINLACGGDNLQHASPVVDVSRFQYLAGLITPSTIGAWVNFTWFADSNATISVGSRSFSISPNIGTGMQCRLPNLGPFVRMAVSPLTAANYSMSSQLIGTNRYHPLEFIPFNPVLILASGLVINAASNALRWPNDYYAGPVQWSAVTTVANCNVVFETLNAVGGLDLLEVTTLNSTVWTSGITVVPPGGWAVRLDNNSGAQVTMTLLVNYSSTGAA